MPRTLNHQWLPITLLIQSGTQVPTPPSSIISQAPQKFPLSLLMPGPTPSAAYVRPFSSWIFLCFLYLKKQKKNALIL